MTLLLLLALQNTDALIKQLGSEDVKVRDTATAALRKIGEPALKALEAAKQSNDPEVRARASALIRVIGWESRLSKVAETWGTRYYIPGKLLRGIKGSDGYLRISARVEGKGEKRKLLLELVMAETNATKSTRAVCKIDPYLTPVSIHGEEKRDGKVKNTWDITVGTKKIDLKSGGETTSAERSKLPLLTEATMFLLPTLLPFDKESNLKVELLFSVHKEPAPKEYEISYVGNKDIRLRGKKMTVHEFQIKRDGSIESSFFVNEKRAVVRWGPQREEDFYGYELVDEKTAKEYLKKLENP